MPGKRVERLQIMLSEEELAAIDEWRFEHRMPSRSAAVRAMLNFALKRTPPGPPAEEPPGEVAPSGDVGILQTPSAAERAMEPRRRRKILVVECERVAAAGITTLLEEAGHEVVAVISGPKEWRESPRGNSFDCAVIGDGLHPELASRMADELSARHIPFVYFSAKPGMPIPDRFRDAPAIDTDASADDFNESLERACA